ncbi:acetyl-CoA carboxylase carboxyltransferase subunit alpha [Rhizosaccharibacter radicis]|uniref:Acetyl-coenzyme A carboxylase carboxyl transferase subunit alpha n=1 Tax=Rhizosaccharibacter radicis TaxID=2782605 RepID=A0ABT1VXI5_9PROT|nr:acetyl-CoA carboxylase carboxyltransferase subunit alpha [Acetobacteraceae bacterium KSS12]
MRQFLDFEKPIAELESKIDELRRLSRPAASDGDPARGTDAPPAATGADASGYSIDEEVSRLSEKAEKQLRATYAKLTPWQKVQVARHSERPHALDYIRRLVTDYMPLAGDRSFSDDQAIVGGLGRFEGQPVVVIGTERGADLDTRLKHNFGMARPEGYRKAKRLVELAGRFGLPVLTFVDTPGAFPGIDAEARGQAEAIARSIEACLAAPVPILATIIGEGGSGGAVALASGDRVLMLEHSIYSVITPEACSSILWRDTSQASTAAEALRLTAQDLKGFGLIDEIVAEPVGGAHRDPNATIAAVGRAVAAALPALLALDPVALRLQRRDKYFAMGRQGLA